MIISGALVGFVTMWGRRYVDFDDDADRAQAAVVTAPRGAVHEPGLWSSRVGTAITVAVTAHLIGWVCILDAPEVPETPP
ncbi:MAG TPA: hypothetical protein VLK82_24450 [Candidatus Tectomicrobia bacterium]|nr:hypothetical protein [Candidatus Tectomicrobia bacterium]